MDFFAYSSIFIVVLFAYFKKSLQRSGIVPALFIGICLYFTGGFSFLIALYAFFISSSFVSKWKKREKEKVAQKVKEKTSNRDCFQVIASGIMPFLFAICFFLSKEDIFYLLVFVSLSISNADTWASELGILSKKDPYTLLPFRKCCKGVSGGVSLFGLFASFLGSLLIAVCSYVTNQTFSWFVYVLIFGFLGSIVDSLLGSSCQVLYYNAKKKQYAEVKQDGYLYQKGLHFMNNEMVNFVSNLITCLLCFLFWTIF